MCVARLIETADDFEIVRALAVWRNVTDDEKGGPSRAGR
jgi:hypothetical protein